MKAIAVVGLGAMGSRIAQRLLSAGHEIIVWNRTPAKLAQLIDLGATAAESPADAARRAEVLITIVSDPAALRAVSEGGESIAAGADATLTVIEMSTVGPAGVARLASALPAGTPLLDAPVLGSIGEAEAGSLTIVVGGPVALVEQAEPLLSSLGSVLHVGPLGAGQAAKLVANATLFSTLATLGEAIALAQGLGLSKSTVYELLAATPLAGQAQRRRDAIERGDYPSRFPLALARKDAELIAEAAVAAGVDLRLIKAARTWLADAEAAGSGNRDYTALLATILASRKGGTDAGSTTIETSEQRHAYDGVIVDLDGVVWLGGHPIDGAAAAIARLRARGTRVLFLTNDPQSSRDEHAARLAALGIPATADDVLTSASATARFLASQSHLQGRSALVIGSRALHEEIAKAGLDLISPDEARQAEVVVVGGHEGFDYAELRAATTAIATGAALFATGRDAVFPTRDGPAPATGAILAAVETATGVTATVIGKPERFVFEIARETLRECDHVAVVGDNLASDIVGAKRSGLDAILVLTGTATREDLEHAVIQPDFVFSSLAELSELSEIERLDAKTTDAHGAPDKPVWGAETRFRL
ncbi:MAG TPA: HAD-IIA family hydrolase [Gaiellaceae bacterium]|nr:HAD-IIA family hydrolase [Gaiellaceae bacterium]